MSDFSKALIADGVEYKLRAETAEAKVRDLEAERDKLREALKDIKNGPPEGAIDLYQSAEIFRSACWRWCQERARQALSGQPDPVRDIQEEMQDCYQFGKVETDPVREAEQAVVDAAMACRGQAHSSGLPYALEIALQTALDALAKLQEHKDG